MHLHLEIELLQHRLEQQVVFEAIAAAPIEQQLLLQVGEVEPDRRAHQRIEVFVRDRRRVQLMQLVQCLQRGSDRTGKADALEPGIDIGL